MTRARKTAPDPLRDPVRHIYWDRGGLQVLDQRRLPREIIYRRCATSGEVAKAIKDMVVRGAPLIGCAAAYGYALAAKKTSTLKGLDAAAKILLASRPTAVNLAHAVRRMRAAARRLLSRGGDLFPGLLSEAHEFFNEDLEANRRMAEAGAALLKPGSTVVTYCNAGALATAGIGTAVGVIRWAHKTGKIKHVYACETRPYLQGSRLTLWELMQAGIPATLITDNMAAHLMATAGVDAVIVGADRIAANADAANKIGTYGLAISARHHKIPFYVAAPSTTVDLSIPDGTHIPIEERSQGEVLKIHGKPIAPAGARARHPAFDVTPHRLITAIVTEKGVVRPARGPRLRRVLSRRPA